MKHIYFFLFVFLYSFSTQSHILGSGKEWCNDLVKTNDNGYLLVGGIDTIQRIGYHIIKLDENFNIQWTQTITDANGDSLYASSVVKISGTNDFLIAVIDYNDGTLVFRIDSLGNVWSYTTQYLTQAAVDWAFIREDTINQYSVVTHYTSITGEMFETQWIDANCNSPTSISPAYSPIPIYPWYIDITGTNNSTLVSAFDSVQAAALWTKHFNEAPLVTFPILNANVPILDAIVSYMHYVSPDTIIAVLHVNDTVLINTQYIWLEKYTRLGPVSISEIIDKMEINVFPNPAHSFINIQTNEDDILYVMDNSGKLILSRTCREGINTVLLDKKFSNGLYYLQLRNKDGIRNKKIIIQ